MDSLAPGMLSKDAHKPPHQRDLSPKTGQVATEHRGNHNTDSESELGFFEGCRGAPCLKCFRCHRAVDNQNIQVKKTSHNKVILIII